MTKLRKYKRKWYLKNIKARRKKHRDYYWNTREDRIRYARAYFIKRRLMFDRLKNKPCYDCQGWFEPYQMDFDHRDAKTKIAALGHMWDCALKRVLKEIDKCDLVCKNCHAIRTQRRLSNADRSNLIRNIDSNKLSPSSRTNKAGMQEPTFL